MWASPDPGFNINGNALVTSTQFFGGAESEDQVLHLSAVRNVQMVKIRDTAESSFVYVNTHLHHPITDMDEHIRAYQVSQMLFWVQQSTTLADKVFIMGDFNAVPESRTYNLLIDAGFKSSHKVVHG